MLKLSFLVLILKVFLNGSTATSLIECSNWISSWQTDCANFTVLSVKVPSKAICETYLRSCSECRVAGFDALQRECHLLTAFPLPLIRSPSQQHPDANQCGAYKAVQSRTKCLPLNPPNNGIVTINRTNDFEQEAIFTCHGCLLVIGHNVSTCRNGSWSHPPPTCAEKELAVSAVIKALGLKTPPVVNGWIVIQNREYGNVSFHRPYQAYIDGFGDMFGDFWWGLEAMHAITCNRTYRLRVEMEAYERGVTFYQEYASFRVYSAQDGYRLFVNQASGTAGDGVGLHSGKQFSTSDHDTDGAKSNCGSIYKAGWWYARCYGSASGNPNGRAQSCVGSRNSKDCMFWTPLAAYSRKGMRRMRMMIK